MSTTILLDANFLMLPHTKKLDVFSEISAIFTGEHELATLSVIVDELGGLSNGPGEDAAAARIALKLVEAKNLRVIESVGLADDAILEYAIKHQKTIVATNDRQLKRRLKSSGVKTVSLHGEDKLTIN